MSVVRTKRLDFDRDTSLSSVLRHKCIQFWKSNKKKLNSPAIEKANANLAGLCHFKLNLFALISTNLRVERLMSYSLETIWINGSLCITHKWSSILHFTHLNEMISNVEKRGKRNEKKNAYHMHADLRTSNWFTKFFCLKTPAIRWT